VIVFHELTMEEVGQIVDLMMARVRRQLESQALELMLTDQAKDLLANRGYDPQLGARPLRRAIQRLLEDPLSEKVLFHEFPAGSTILVDVDEDGTGLTFAPVSAPDQPPVELAKSSDA
jgi:ATP-dependent Clp protease ATP-binding subunit ClpC